jgi:hypothetical protein
VPNIGLWFCFAVRYTHLRFTASHSSGLALLNGASIGNGLVKQMDSTDGYTAQGEEYGAYNRSVKVFNMDQHHTSDYEVRSNFPLGQSLGDLPSSSGLGHVLSAFVRRAWMKRK